MRGRALGQEATDDGSDSEEELAAFCPKVTASGRGKSSAGKNKAHCGDMQHLAVCQHSVAESDGRADEDTLLSDRSFPFCPTKECPELLVPAAVS